MLAPRQHLSLAVPTNLTIFHFSTSPVLNPTMRPSSCLIVASTLALFASVAHGHGRLIAPPHRGWLYTLPQFTDLVPADYDDDGLSAGGIGSTQSGTHGICGDPYSQQAPRPHETGGGVYALFPKYGSKVIGGCFAPGQTMDLTVEITANHKGYFEFALCKLNGRTDAETEQCFNATPLVQPNGQKQWPLPAGIKTFNMQYVLPAGITCEGDSHCVLRWHYTGWNNADVGIDGQEQFWNCADIYISNNCNNIPPSPPATTPSPPSPPTKTPARTPLTTSPTTLSPTKTPSPSPGDKCNGSHGCYWPDTNQIVPYEQSICLLYSSFIWCP
ncbi:Aste57867_2659 [Aphanomyces stellatus]|uniref:Aste57867_2659 protein n=1 Tax=Aphanomyces stellatus TaxID=120398 RepID=A0A485K8S4_9STRA|nr:hypothetical protein As57867_002652 [Aphanomyces stellatus]VFT79853.1 Aste57867_2659 [Aphanomyces stellatus]